MSDQTLESDSTLEDANPPEYGSIISDEAATQAEDSTLRPARSWISEDEETDPILWCLTCHQPGHRSSDCSETPSTGEDRPSNNVQLRPSQRSVDKSLNIFALRDVQEAEYKSYIARRDAAFTRLHNEMSNRNIPEYRCKIWVTNMSWWNQTIHTYFLELMRQIDRIKDEVNAFKCQNATIEEYLTRCNPEQGRRIADRMVSSLTDSLKSLRKLFRRHSDGISAATLQSVLNCLEMEELQDAERIWVAKAFRLASDLQPAFEDDEMCIIRLSLPDVDDEIEAVGLWSSESVSREDRDD